MDEYTEGRTYIGKQEEREEVDERIWEFLVLFHRVPDLYRNIERVSGVHVQSR